MIVKIILSLLHLILLHKKSECEQIMIWEKKKRNYSLWKGTPLFCGSGGRTITRPLMGGVVNTFDQGTMCVRVNDLCWSEVINFQL